MSKPSNSGLIKLLADLQIDLDGAPATSPLHRLLATVDAVCHERDLLKAAFDAFPGPISWVSSDLRYLGVNRHLEKLTAMPFSRFCGQEVGFAEREGRFDRFVRDFVRSPASEDHQLIEVKTGAADKWFSMTAKKYDGDSKAVVVGIDVTELQYVHNLIANLQQQATVVARLASLGEMAAGMTHEIGNPLTAIAGAAYELREAVSAEPLNRELASELLDLIEQAAAHISQIVDGARHLSRNDKRPTLTITNAKKLVDEALALCGEKAKQAGAKVSATIPPDLEFECAPSEILQVLINLISNACDAVAPLPERWIRVNAKRSGATVAITVADSGSGIPESLRQKIMQPFFTTKPPGQGTGIGLSISRSILERYQGHLDIDMTATTTCFVMTLPARQEELSAPSAPSLP